MVDMIQNFMDAIHERKHILELLQKNERILVEFKSRGKTAKLSLANGDFYLGADNGPYIVRCQIFGEPSAIQLLLEGKVPLRQLVSQGKLGVSAPFRTVLLLESLFYLTKAECNWKQAL